MLTLRALGDVRGDRRDSSSKLRSAAEALVAGKGLRQSVGRQYEGVAALPDLQIGEPLHDEPSEGRTRRRGPHTIIRDHLSMSNSSTFNLQLFNVARSATRSSSRPSAVTDEKPITRRPTSRRILSSATR